MSSYPPVGGTLAAAVRVYVFCRDVFARRVCGRVAIVAQAIRRSRFWVRVGSRSFLSSYPTVGGTLAAVGRVNVFSPRRYRTPCFRSRSYRRASHPSFALLGKGRESVVFVELSNRRRYVSRRRARLRFFAATFSFA